MLGQGGEEISYMPPEAFLNIEILGKRTVMGQENRVFVYMPPEKSSADEIGKFPGKTGNLLSKTENVFCKEIKMMLRSKDA